MGDLINELRTWANQCSEPPDGCRRRAADEIERLTGEVEEARTVGRNLLRFLRNYSDTPEVCADYAWLEE